MVELQEPIDISPEYRKPGPLSTIARARPARGGPFQHGPGRCGSPWARVLAAGEVRMAVKDAGASQARQA
jgi:hypothetical protein